MPGTCCCVRKCHGRGGHAFPVDKKRKEAWVWAVRRVDQVTLKDWVPSTSAVVCSAHFSADDYCQQTQYCFSISQKRLKPKAVPHIFPWTKVPSELVQNRKARADKRDLGKQKVEETCQEKLEKSFCEDVDFQEEEVLPDNLLQPMPLDEQEIEQRDASIQTNCNPIMSVDNFVNDDAAVHFYTGLETYAKFCFVLNSLGPAAYCLNYISFKVASVSVPNQLFMTLMKLRRYTTNFELSRFFAVSEATVLNIIYTWILFMSKQWKEINLWPCQKLVRYFAPVDFKRKFPTTRVIVDGTECPVKKPKAPTAQQATFSSYKNRNTVKVLIGSTPGGLISYVWSAFGGSTSDRQIVERGNLVNLCDPGDSVMADKGFNVQDLFATQNVSVNIPTFFKKMNRLSGKTLLRDRKISSKRVHIERIIGLGKTYKILTIPLTSTETKLASHIIFVCFMLCNFRSCIVSKYA